jgi:outer membrane receptor protein involved in Fe transport
MSIRSVSNLRRAFAFVASASVFAVAGFAQQTAAPAANDTAVKLDKLVVTGSNIPRTETAGEAQTFPVQVIDRVAIEASGVFNTSELLQKMTLSNAGSVPVSNNATGFTPGGNSTSLRGLGPEATLVLINGRRVAPYPIGAGGTTAFVDLNSIPLAAIERIEVLKDGASATYGADAVAGVVNIILRKNYNGATASLQYGNTTNLDSSEFNASLVYGITSDTGSLTFGANYSMRQPIFNKDRDYSAIPAFLSSNASPPNFQLSRDAVLQALGLPAGSPLTINGVANTTTNTFFGSTYDVRTTNKGNLPASAYKFTTGRSSSFNYNEFSGSYPEITRRGMFTAWEKDFFGKKAKFFGDAMYQGVTEYDELAPYATGNFASPGQKTIVIPAKTANPILTAAETAAGLGRTAVAGAYNPFNPFNQDISGSSRIRLAEFGNRVYETTNTAFAMTGGLRFDNVADKYTVNAVGRYSQIENNQNNRLINTSRMLRSLNAADPIFNPASSEYIGTTSPYNPFGYYKNTIPSNSAPVAYATQYQRDHNMSKLFDGGISATTGELMPLPAGDVGFALGVDFRREAIDQRPDSSGQAGEILAQTPSSPISRQRKVVSYYTEFEIPIFGEKNAQSLAKHLSLNLAGRYEDFVTSKQTVFVPKVGIHWMPVDDTLVVRASWGKGFLQPSLYQLYAPPVSALTNIKDPVTGVNEPEQSVTSSGNKNLASETSKSYNLGVVWTPKGTMQGFTFAVDFWRIERNGTVSIDHQDTLDRSVAGKLIPGETVVRDFAGNLVQVNGVYRNLGQTEVQGIDFTTSYTWKTENMGRFEAGLNLAYIDSFKIDFIGDGNLVDYIGQGIPGDSSDDGYLQWKGQGWVGWNFKGINARLTGTYTDGFADLDLDSNPRQVASTIFYDFQASYTLFPSKSQSETKWWTDMKLTAGVNNLLDTDPPLAQDEGNNSTNYPGHLYTNVGRFVYFQLEKKL